MAGDPTFVSGKAGDIDAPVMTKSGINTAGGTLADSLSLFKPGDHATRVEQEDRNPGALERFCVSLHGKLTGPVASRLAPY